MKRKNTMLWVLGAFAVYYLWKKNSVPAVAVTPALPAPQTTLQPPPGITSVPAGVAGLNW